MATKKTTTRGKTKTTTTKTRTAAAKTAKPTAKATKTTKSTANKTNKTTVKISQTSAKRPSLLARLRTGRSASTVSAGTMLPRLRRLQLVSLVAFIALAVAAGTLMKTTTMPLSLGHLGGDTLASHTQTVFAAAKEPVFDLEIRWALVAILGIAALFSLLNLTRLKTQYQDALTNRVSKWRWIEMAITSALMVELVAVLSGFDDIASLKLLGGLMVIAAACGWVVERAAANGRPARPAYFISIFANVLAGLAIVSYALATVVYGAVRSPWYVYVTYVILLLSGLLIIRNLRRSALVNTDYQATELKYTAIGLLTKVAFAAVLIIGLNR